MQAVIAGCALLFSGASAYAANVNKVPTWLWVGLISSAIASVEVAILNLWVNWSRVEPANPEPIPVASQGLSRAINLQTPILTDVITFSYLPNSPLENGWRLGYEGNGAQPKFERISEKDETRLRMTVGEFFAMDHPIPSNSQFSRSI